MDEPLSNLDAKLRVQMRGEISRLQRELGTTMMYVTHDQVEAMTLGDRVAVMLDGVLQQLAPPSALYASPATVFVAGFVGSPPMNLCRARIEHAVGAGPVVRFGSSSFGVDRASIDKYPLVAERVGDEVVLGTRPESFFIPDGDVPDDRRIRTRVDLVEILGADALVYLQIDAKPLGNALLDAEEETDGTPRNGMFVARMDPRAAPQRGDVIDIAYETDALHFFDLKTGGALR
jgi:multiple sugar transport system ATP-binding protein